jgi:hypothetical protein
MAPGPARGAAGVAPVVSGLQRALPNTRDSWSMIARKPDGWAPKLELDDKEMLEQTGLTCWDDLGH